MRTSLLPGCLVVLIGFGLAQSALAQSILAGQSAGVVYTDLIPDKTLSGITDTPRNYSETSDSLDLNGDGNNDFKLLIYHGIKKDAGQHNETFVFVTTMHANAELAAETTDFTFISAINAHSFLANENIQAQVKQPLESRSGVAWVNKFSAPSRYNSHFDYNLASATFNPFTGTNYEGYWCNKQDGYLGVRLRATSTAPWQYGWVRLQVTTNQLEHQATIIVKDYALQSTLLPSRPGSRPRWQVYPTFVTDQLTVQPPDALAGSLMVVDICGRTQLNSALTGGRQQLDFSSLASGIYIVRLETPAGSFVQRIVKQ